MMKYLSKFKVIMALLLVVLLVVLLVSACDIDRARLLRRLPETGITAPSAGARILVNSPVLIQSVFEDADKISRVELWIEKKGGVEAPKLLRADIPENGIVRQEWTPREPATYIVKLQPYDTANKPLDVLTRTMQVVNDPSISLLPPIQGDLQAENVEPVPGAGAGFQPPDTDTAFPTATPGAPTPTGAPAQPAQQAAITIVATSTPLPTPTPIPRYPPPPPIPGVPPGPTQAQIPKLTVPVCDAAEYLGPYVPPDPDIRQVIVEADDVAAKTVGGTTVHRIWQLRNIGTCTWGPGYELAFYGGRSMGSGGVAFEGFTGFQPERRNFIEDTEHLIVPEGKPNQVALLEVVLNAPVTPGIHQSYWRMRNPQGVFFGPIIGVTLEVVRECEFGIYGAPQINRFEILGVGNVFRPDNPVDVKARLGETVMLDWSIINADNYDILVKEPTGDVTNLATRNFTDRRGFIPDELGQHTITLIADNGSCTAQAQVKVDVLPPEGGEFTFNVVFASNAPVTTADTNASFSANVRPGTLDVQWQHFDKEVNEIIFHADLYRKVTSKSCPPFVDPNGSAGWLCWDQSEWQFVRQQAMGRIGQQPGGSTTVCNTSSELCAAIQQGDPRVQEVMSIAEHLKLIYCEPSTSGEQYGVAYYLEAKKDGVAAAPAVTDDEVFVQCGGGQSLPTEIQ